MVEQRFKSLGQLADIMVTARGLECDDPKALERFLLVNNYARVEGYAREFQLDPSHGDKRFEPGTSFEKVRLMMDLDQRLSDLVFSGLSTIEIAVRSLFAHEYGTAYGSGAFYLDDDFYDYEKMEGARRRLDVPLSVARDLARYSASRIVRRYRDPGENDADRASLLRSYRDVPCAAGSNPASPGTFRRCGRAPDRARW